MTKLLEDAIERLRELPESRQNELAAALIDVAEGDQGDYHLTDEQVKEMRRRRSNPNRKFVSLARSSTQTFTPPSRMRVIIEESAIADIDGLAAWAAKHGPQRARSTVERIQETMIIQRAEL